MRACGRRRRSGARASLNAVIPAGTAGIQLPGMATVQYTPRPHPCSLDPGTPRRDDVALLTSIRVRGNRHVVAHGPQAFEAVELADAWQHHVHDDVAQIDEHPFGFLLPFHAERHHARLFYEADDFIGERFDVTRGSAARDDEDIGDAGLAADVDFLHVLGFQLVEREEYLLAQDFDRIGLGGGDLALTGFDRYGF